MTTMLFDSKKRLQAFRSLIDNIANYSIDEIYFTFSNDPSLMQQVKDGEGNETITALIKLWVKAEHLMQRQSLKSILLSKIWWTMSYVSLIQYSGEMSFIEHGVDTPFLLHAAISFACPPSFIKSIIQKNPLSPFVEDNFGQTALSVAAKAQNRKEWCREIISCLIEANPMAARRRTDPEGYPLHLALKSGKLWDFGVKMIFEAAPDVLKVKDPTTGLYPWAIAAKEVNRDREHIYDDIYVSALDEIECGGNFLDKILMFGVNIIVNVLMKYFFILDDEMSDEITKKDRQKENQKAALKTAYSLLIEDPSLI